MRAPTLDHGASASLALRGLLRGSDVEVAVLAAVPRAVYLAVPAAPSDGDPGVPRVVTLVTADGIAHPNALRLAASGAEEPFADLDAGAGGVVGHGRVRVGRLVVRVRRWWDPRPVLTATTPAALAARLAVVEDHRASARRGGADPVIPVDDGGGDDRFRGDPARWLVPVVDALRRGDGPPATAAARGLLGRGPGSTPAGDDALAGLFAGVRLLAPAVGHHPGAAGPTPAVRGVRPGPPIVDVAARAGAAIAAAAVGRTTSVSAALLAHAVRGEVADPAAQLLRALVGRGELGAAVDGLLAVGASSGSDLAAGILAAGWLVCDRAAATPRTAGQRCDAVPALPPHVRAAGAR